MKDHISDEQLDIRMRELLKSSAADDRLVNDVADSPKLWWNIQRQINEQAADQRSPWPPVKTWIRWLAIGVPATAAVVMLVLFMLFRLSASPDTVATVKPAQESVFDPDVAINEPAAEQTVHSVIASKTKSHNSRTRDVREQPKIAAVRAVQRSLPMSKPVTEIKTEFIALSYARDPESGQLVRVKVPSSMMVSLGVVTSVKKPTDLVDAEVLVGDDGLTRAIRFLRSN